MGDKVKEQEQTDMAALTQAQKEGRWQKEKYGVKYEQNISQEACGSQFISHSVSDP